MDKIKVIIELASMDMVVFRRPIVCIDVSPKFIKDVLSKYHATVDPELSEFLARVNDTCYVPLYVVDDERIKDYRITYKETHHR